MIGALLLALTVTIQSPPPAVGGETVTFAAQVTPAGNYLYKWWRLALYGPDATVAYVPQSGWTTEATLNYQTPVGGGRNQLVVWVKDAHSLADYDAYGVAVHAIAPAPTPACGPLTLSAFDGARSNMDGQHYVPIAGKSYTGGSYPFPFTVPAGKTYNVTSINFLGKLVATESGIVQGAGVIFNNLFTIGVSTPLLFPQQPLPLPEGFVLDGYFSNGTTTEPMNVMVLVVGRLEGDGC